MLRSLLVVLLLLPSLAFPFTEEQVNRIAPGCLCSANDPDFDGLRYPEQIPHCRRNVSTMRKNIVKQWFGIPKDQWKDYEVDHRLSLWVGGSNEDCNLVPIGAAKHHVKNILERDLRGQIKAGTMTQSEAIERFQQWYHDCFFRDQC
jgi:hypothetical protein